MANQQYEAYRVIIAHIEDKDVADRNSYDWININIHNFHAITSQNNRIDHTTECNERNVQQGETTSAVVPNLFSLADRFWADLEF